MIYEWDAQKAKSNLRKHTVSFEDAATVFLDPLALTFPERRNRIRIISAPEATRGERKQYEEGIGEEKI